MLWTDTARHDKGIAMSNDRTGEGKVAIVTGGGTGIGKAISELVLGSSDRRELTHFWHSLRGPLKGILPNIRRLECCGLQAYFQTDECPSAMWPRLQGYPHALQRLVTMRLSGYRFHSFTTLQHEVVAFGHRLPYRRRSPRLGPWQTTA